MTDPDPPVIRSATEGDIEAVARLLIQVQDQHVRDYPRMFKPMPMAVAVATVAPDIAAGRYTVADRGGVVGFIKWFIHDRPDSAYTFATRIVAIDAIGVDVTCRRRGIGQSLLAWEIERGRVAGVERVQLDSWGLNTGAHAAFEKAGFTAYNFRFWRLLR